MVKGEKKDGKNKEKVGIEDDEGKQKERGTLEMRKEDGGEGARLKVNEKMGMIAEVKDMKPKPRGSILKERNARMRRGGGKGEDSERCRGGQKRKPSPKTLREMSPGVILTLRELWNMEKKME